MRWTINTSETSSLDESSRVSQGGAAIEGGPRLYLHLHACWYVPTARLIHHGAPDFLNEVYEWFTSDVRRDCFMPLPPSFQHEPFLYPTGLTYGHQYHNHCPLYAERYGPGISRGCMVRRNLFQNQHFACHQRWLLTWHPTSRYRADNRFEVRQVYVISHKFCSFTSEIKPGIGQLQMLATR